MDITLGLFDPESRSFQLSIRGQSSLSYQHSLARHSKLNPEGAVKGWSRKLKLRWLGLGWLFGMLVSTPPGASTEAAVLPRRLRLRLFPACRFMPGGEMQRLRMVLGSGLLLLAGAVLCGAQTGLIDGTVSDSAGAVIPGAAITVRNQQSGASRSVPSNGVGAFSIPDLPVGTYDLTVAKAGFKTFQVSDARLSVNQSLTVAASLEPGAVNEEIEVRGDQLLTIDLDTAQVSNLVDQTEIRDLPLITRNPYDLILLSPGTSETNALGVITVNGSRERNNNFLLDGVDNNDTSVPGRIGGVLNINADSAEEFRVITNNFNAEFGRNTGAIVDVVTA